MRSLLVLLALLAASPAAAGRDFKPSEPVLVVPFENASSDPRLEWVSEASALLLTRDLARFGVAAIPREERLKAFERLGLPPSALLSRATIIRVGQLIGATHVVIGHLTSSDRLLELQVASIRLDTGSLEGEIVEKGALDGLFGMVERVARRMAPGAAARPASSPSPSLRAFELYVKGLTAETPAAQVRLLQSALALAPADDAIRIALWQVHTSQGDHERALAVAAKVAGASPLATRARFLAALSEIYRGRNEAALEQLKALADESPAATVLNNLGVVQLRRAAAGQPARAADYFRRAAESSPEDSDYAFNVGYACWFERDADAAVHWLREAVRRNPSDADAHFVLGVALQASGASVEGGRERELARQLSSRYSEWRRPPAGEVPRGLERLRLDIDAPRLSLLERIAAPAEQRELRQLAAFHADRGRRLFDAQHDVEALAELKRSLYLLPYQAGVHLLVGRIHQRAGRLQEASESFRISIWCEATADAHAALGEVLFELDDPVGARTEANRALALDLQHQAARALLKKTEK